MGAERGGRGGWAFPHEYFMQYLSVKIGEYSRDSRRRKSTAADPTVARTSSKKYYYCSARIAHVAERMPMRSAISRAGRRISSEEMRKRGGRVIARNYRAMDRFASRPVHSLGVLCGATSSDKRHVDSSRQSPPSDIYVST